MILRGGEEAEHDRDEYEGYEIELTPVTMMYLFGIFVATLITAIAPYIRKFGTDFSEWNNAYTLTFIISYVVAMVATILIYNINPLDINVADPFVKGFVLGLWNPIVNEVAKYIMPNLFKPVGDVDEA